MHYVNAWLKRCVFNLDLNRESVSEPRTLSGRLFQSLGAKYEKALPPLVNFAILGTSQVKSSHLYLYSAFNNTDCVKALNSIKLEDRVSVMYNNKIKHSIFS